MHGLEPIEYGWVAGQARVPSAADETILVEAQSVGTKAIRVYLSGPVAGASGERDRARLPRLVGGLLIGVGLGVLAGAAAPKPADAVSSPPWPASYKIKPHEQDRLTPADVPGPDGIVYPDWRYAGVPGGIPEVPERVRIEDFGAGRR